MRAATNAPGKVPGKVPAGPSLRPSLRRVRILGLLAVLALVGAALMPGTQGSFTGTVRSAQNVTATRAFFDCRSAAAAIGTSNTVLSYRLDDPTGASKTVDYSGNSNTGNYSGQMRSTALSPQACPNDGGGAYTLDGSTSYLSSSRQGAAPQAFSVEVWFRTATPGGRIIGFGNLTSGLSSSFDRHIYLTAAGQVAFGVYDGAVRNAVISPESYNDDSWHHVVATLSPVSGMTLYVDGIRVGSKWSVKVGKDYSGYWRLGYDNTASWPGTTANLYYAGQLRYANVYRVPLAPGDVLDRYLAGAPTSPSTVAAVNLAQERPSTQSSEYGNGDPAANATDGNTDGDYMHGSVVHTAAEPNAWWQVDLKQVRSIAAINVYNRTDCCGARLSNYWIFTANTPFDTSKPPAAHARAEGTTWSTHQTVEAGSPTRLTLPPGVTGRYVLLQQDDPANPSLNFAEFEVMSPGSP